MAKIIILGPAHPLRGGGMTTFNHRLAKEFLSMGHECAIWSFSLQYPSFLFPGKSQYTDEPPPKDIIIHSKINAVNPLNWMQVGYALKNEKPDIVVVRYWLPFMGPALGTILRICRKNRHTKIICIADNIIPHEKRPGDTIFTRYFVKTCNGFITMSEKVLQDLKTFTTSKPTILVSHPLYDNFGEILTKEAARNHLHISHQDKVLVFFGFIRKYKGLDILYHAMKEVKDYCLSKNQSPVKLLAAGEFYEDESVYATLAQKLGIEDVLILKTNFIPDEDVKYYICAADAIVQPYRHATQSGVSPLAYYFEKPMIVTNVGGLPSLVPHEKCGIVTEPTATDIAAGIKRFYELGEDYFLPYIRAQKAKLNWGNMVNAIINMAAEIKS